MSELDQFWLKFAQSKDYRESFVAAQVKSGIPFQIRKLMDQESLSQTELAARAGITQGVVSRAADPEYGSLTINTILRIAAGFDVAFIGQFVPFSDLAKWLIELPLAGPVDTFQKEDEKRAEEAGFFTFNAARLPTIPFSEDERKALQQDPLSGWGAHQRQPNSMKVSEGGEMVGSASAKNRVIGSPGSLKEGGHAINANAA